MKDFPDRELFSRALTSALSQMVGFNTDNQILETEHVSILLGELSNWWADFGDVCAETAPDIGPRAYRFKAFFTHHPWHQRGYQPGVKPAWILEVTEPIDSGFKSKIN